MTSWRLDLDTMLNELVLHGCRLEASDSGNIVVRDKDDAILASGTTTTEAVRRTLHAALNHLLR